MNEKDLFLEAYRSSDPAERDRYMEKVCADRPELLARVRELLRLSDEVGSLMDPPEATTFNTMTTSTPGTGDTVSSVIGPYKLLESIGEGGMGTVYMAEQTSPVRRLVALRMIKQWPVPNRNSASAAFDATLKRSAVVGEDGSLVVERVADRSELARMPSLGQFVSSWYLQFSPDGRWLSVIYGSSGSLRVVVWDIEARKIRFEVPTSDEQYVDFDQAARLFAYRAMDDSIRVHDLDTNAEKLRIVDADLEHPTFFEFHPLGPVLAVSAPRSETVKIFDFAQGGKKVALMTMGGPSRYMAWSHDGSKIAVSVDREVAVMEIPSGRRLSTLKGHQALVCFLRFHPTENLLVSDSWDDSFRVASGTRTQASNWFVARGCAGALRSTAKMLRPITNSQRILWNSYPAVKSGECGSGSGCPGIIAMSPSQMNHQFRPWGLPLEDRTLLATIQWVNRGTPSNDSDSFASVFGTRAELARNVVDAGIDSWERTIVDFNYPDGTYVFSLTANMNTSLTGANLGAFANFTDTKGGKPSAGFVTLGRGTDGLGNGWYLDAAPDDWSEFENIVNVFAASTGTLDNSRQSDFYSIALREIGHTVGLSSSNPVTNLSVNTSQPDTASGPTGLNGTGPSANLWGFSGPSVSTLMTAYNASSPPADFGGPVHADPAGSSTTWNGQTYVGLRQLMNPRYSFFTPTSIPDTGASILQDAYAYTIALPQSFGTMFASLDSTTGELVVRGRESSDDIVSITTVANQLEVSVDLGIDDNGTGAFPGTDLPAFVSYFDLSGISRFRSRPKAESTRSLSDESPRFRSRSMPGRMTTRFGSLAELSSSSACSRPSSMSGEGAAATESRSSIGSVSATFARTS